MKKTIILFTFLVFGSSIAIAQNQSTRLFAKHSLYVEGLGNGFVYSVNYEYHFSSKWSIRAGGAWIQTDATYTFQTSANVSGTVQLDLLTVPILANYKWGSQNHKIEIGAGLLLSRFVAPDIAPATGFGVDLGYTARVGYLYYPFAGGLNFRVAYTPLLTGTFSNSFGVGVGYGF